MLVAVVLLVALASLVGFVLYANIRARQAAALPVPAAGDATVPAAVETPVFGLVTPGPDFAPQPVSPTAITAQSHRPIVIAPTTAGRLRSQRAGAHRRESDAEEMARLDALHEAGQLSREELASLKARLN